MVELLDTKETAQVLRMSIYSIRSWAQKGILPVIRPGRKCLFRRQDIDDFIKRSARPAQVKDSRPQNHGLSPLQS